MSKLWLITGSSRGPGRALAKAVLETGRRTVATVTAVFPSTAERYSMRAREALPLDPSLGVAETAPCSGTRKTAAAGPAKCDQIRTSRPDWAINSLR
jgi:NAD(P)-dependent dehydrogenase (short-subunit alcohol dehydrogenase family)